MKKYLAVVVPALLLVIVGQWLVSSRLRRENQILRDTRHQAEQSRLELEQTVKSARRSDTDAQALRTQLDRLRGELQRVRLEMDQAKKTPDRATQSAERASTSPRADAPASEAMPAGDATPSSVVLTTKDVDPDSIKVVGLYQGGGNLRFRLRGKSSDEIGAMAGIRKCDIIIDGQIAIGAARWVEGETNAGLILAFDTKAQAEAAAAALRRESTR